MCVTVAVITGPLKQDWIEADNYGDLKALVKAEPVYCGEVQPKSHHCLCCTDLEATAEKASMKISDGFEYGCSYVLTPNAEPRPR